MTAKRIVLIILCVLMIVMVVLFAVVGSKFLPLLRLLTGTPGPKPPATTTLAPQTSVPPTTVTTPPTTEPTTAPTTEPTVPPTTEPTEPPHVHVYSVSKVVEAACGTPGYTIYVCECGKTDIRDYQEGKSHVYGTGTRVDATCEEQGYTEYTCESCGYIDRRNHVDPIGHDYELVETVVPTCVQDGYDLHRCKNCQGEKKENEIIAPGHTCEEWTQTTPPGPGQNGEDSAVCTVCGETVTRPCELEIRSITPIPFDDYHSYIVCVGTKTTDKAITYIINDYSRSNKLRFSYSEAGLLVKYDGVELTTLQALQELTLTIDENGNIVAGDPAQPSEPTEPMDPTDPSDPSNPSDPSEPVTEETEN